MKQNISLSINICVLIGRRDRKIHFNYSQELNKIINFTAASLHVRAIAPSEPFASRGLLLYHYLYGKCSYYCYCH